MLIIRFNHFSTLVYFRFFDFDEAAFFFCEAFFFFFFRRESSSESSDDDEDDELEDDDDESDEEELEELELDELDEESDDSPASGFISSTTAVTCGGTIAVGFGAFFKCSRNSSLQEKRLFLLH